MYVGYCRLDMRILTALGIVAVVMLLSACAPTPIKYYPNFAAGKSSLGTTVLLADVFIIEGIVGDTEKVDVPLNRELGDSLIEYFSQELGKVGYPITRPTFASVGTPLNKRGVYRYALTPDDQQLDATILPVGNPPFYIQENFKDTSMQGIRWRNVCRALLETPFEPEASHTIIQDVAALGENLHATTLCVLFATGFNVPVTQRIIDKESTPNVRIGRTGDEYQSQSSLTIYMVDVQSGELLWSDQLMLKGGTVYLGKLVHLVDLIIARLP